MSARDILAQRDFHAIAAQLAPEGRRDLVARVEAAFRRAIGVEKFTDDEIVVARLNPDGQTALERAGLAVVRACLAFREAADADRGVWLDRIGFALADAESVRLDGVAAREARRKGNRESAKKRSAADRHAALRKEIRDLLSSGKKVVVKKLVRPGAGKSTVAKLVKEVREEIGASK